MRARLVWMSPAAPLGRGAPAERRGPGAVGAWLRSARRPLDWRLLPMTGCCRTPLPAADIAENPVTTTDELLDLTANH
jgi:hypothetical protein